MSGSLLVFGHVVDVIECDIESALSGQRYNLARHVRGNLLRLLFAVADISLRYADLSGERVAAAGGGLAELAARPPPAALPGTL